MIRASSFSPSPDPASPAMHSNQAMTIAAFPMRKLSEAFGPKRRKTNAKVYSKRRASAAIPSSPPTAPDNAVRSTEARMVLSPTQVFESDVSLLPDSHCLENHGKGKAALRHDQDPHEPTRKDCGYYTECDEASISPATALTEDYRLETLDPLHDLKRWTTLPNQRISGESCPCRTEEEGFIARSRFAPEALAKCILWAAEEVRQLHFKVHLQVRYLGARPYEQTFVDDPIKDANPLHTLPTTLKSLMELNRDELVHLMADMATELNYLQGRICLVRKEILQLKWARAKSGDWGEIMDLIESGWISVENVQKECCV